MGCHKGLVLITTWSPDGNKIATYSSDLAIRVWNLPAMILSK